jgi:hypothetical protein
MVRVVEDLLEPGVTEFGEKLHDACLGNPLQVRLTESGNDPPIADTVIV